MITSKNTEFLANFGSPDVHETLMKDWSTWKNRDVNSTDLANHPSFDFEKHGHYFKDPRYGVYPYGLEETHTKDPARIKELIGENRAAYTLAKHSKHLNLDHYHELIDRGYENAVLSGKSSEKRKEIFDSYIAKSKDEDKVSDLAFEAHRYLDLSDHVRHQAKTLNHPGLRKVMATIAQGDEIDHVINHGSSTEKFQLVATNPNITHEHLDRVESQKDENPGLKSAIEIRRTIGKALLNPFNRK